MLGGARMSLKYIFTVGKEKRLSYTAAILAKLFYPQDATTIINLDQTHSLEVAEENSIENIITLGHSDTEYYGHYKAITFCEQFAKQFTEKQKKSLKHLYLIGCEVGLIKNGQCIAQTVADELYRLKFTNIQVHSIAKPEDAYGEFMYVEIIERAGAAKFRGVKEGYINAYLLNKEDATRLNQLLEDRNRNIDEINRIIREQAFIFVKESDPLEELSKPNNIFFPQETENARKDRIENHFYSKLSEEQRKAIELLTRRRDYELGKGSKKIARKINFIINRIKIAKPQEYQDIIKKSLKYFRFKMLGINFNRKSNTTKILLYLCEGKISQAAAIVDKQASSMKEELMQDEQRFARTFFSEAKTDTFSREENKTKEDEKNNTYLRLAKKEMNGLIKKLEDEITGLQQGCFFFLNRYEINTKREKRKALQNLIKITDFQCMQKEANALLQNDRVMRSKKTWRTNVLLNTIAKNPEKLVVKARQEIRNKYGH